MKDEEWERQHFATEQERIRRRDKRLRAVGEFFKWGIAIAAGVSALGFGGYYACGGIRNCEATQEKEQVQLERLDLYYENQWIDCINDHGREQCQIWAEVGLHRCRNILNCAHDAFVDRRAGLPDEETEGDG